MVMKKHEGEPWMPADEYGRSLKGLGVSLVVRNMARSLVFQKEVLGVEVVYSDADFAALRGFGSEWMLHTDHTYEGNPLYGSLLADVVRGIGIELRLHGCDPDETCIRARTHEFMVLDDATDKPHGLREAYIIDDDGYVWVPDVPII
jgi:catechol 2,3-dioxygenase-like lactoylglutathione lyase family enzyme